MAEATVPLGDIRFVCEHVVDLAGLTRLPAFAHLDVETVLGVVEENARFVAEVVAPLNRSGDVQHSSWADGRVTMPDGFRAAYRKFVAAGWGGVAFPPDYDGGGFPWLVGMILQESLAFANMSFGLSPLLTQGAIDMLVHHGSEEQKERYLPRMVTGEWTGSMNLTEPQAGSDVGALTTRATPVDDGTYRITGQKIFITYGDHDMADNIVHLVLARLAGAPPGTKGISCFIVPKFLVNEDGSLGPRNGVECVSIERKMGINASPTCVMAYEDAVGYLVGEANDGMRYMFTMMNTARLSVGVQGLGVAGQAYQQALRFASERRQGRAVGAPAGEQSLLADLPDVRRMLLTMRAIVEAMRCLAYANAEAIDLSLHHTDPATRQRYDELADLLTPITKGWCTDMGVEVTSTALQVFGGMGYIEETGVAQLYRDARITPIYEGTNGIQAIDLAGRKLPMRSGGVVADWLASVEATAQEAVEAGDELAPLGERLAEAQRTLREATDWLLGAGPADPNDMLAGATPYLRMCGWVAGGWLLTRSAIAAARLLDEGGLDAVAASRLEQKIVTAQFYGEHLLPQVGGLLPAVTAGYGLLGRYSS